MSKQSWRQVMAEFHGARLTVYDALTSMGRMRPEVTMESLEQMVTGRDKLCSQSDFSDAVRWLKEHGLMLQNRERWPIPMMWTVPVQLAAWRWKNKKDEKDENAHGGSGTPGVPLEAAPQPAVHTHQGRLFP